MTKVPKPTKQVLARLKIYLLKGNSITCNQGLFKFRTNRLSEYISRLRKMGYKIKTTMHYNGRDSYGSYSLVIPKKKKLKFNP